MSVSGNRLQKHRANLNKLIRDDRLTPNRRLLAEMLAMMMDGVIPLTLVESVFGSPSKVRLDDSDDPPTDPNRTKLETDAHADIKRAMAELMGGISDTTGKS